MYGVDPHPCKDQEGIQLYLGLTPEGIAIIREAKKVSGFPWSDVLKVSYDGKVFYVQVQKEERKANYGFRLPDHGACKHLWKCAIEHHTFYSNEAKSGKVRRSSSLSPQKFFKRHSRYQYSGRTQDQVIKESEKIQRPTPEIKRTPSIRISAKPDMSKRSSESSNNNRGLLDTPTGNGSASNSSGSDPLKEFETEHIPDVPAEDQIHSQTDGENVVSRVDNHVGAPVAEIGSSSENSTKPAAENSSALTVLFILLIIALILIPVAVVIQSNKEAVKSSSAYQGWDHWFYKLTGMHAL